MASNPLVDTDLDRGLALVHALSETGMPIEFVAWTYSDFDSEWRLVLATPYVDEHGTVATLEAIGGVLSDEPELDPGIGRLVVVSPSEAGVLRAKTSAASFDNDEIVRPGNAGTIQGRSFDASRVYNAEALEFEESVLRTLQRVAPPSAVVRRSPRFAETGSEFDFLVDAGNGPLVIEAKASRRPLTYSQVASLRSRAPVGVPVLAISKNGFSPDAQKIEVPGLRLLTWRDESAEADLSASLDELLPVRN